MSAITKYYLQYLLRLPLLPFAGVYQLFMAVRNWAFDLACLKSYKITGKSIVVGNLSVGGTGKSPHIIFLNEHLQKFTNTAILSRGYGRKTQGLLWAQPDSTPEDIGDEPKMFQQRFPQTPIVLSEARTLGAQSIRENLPSDTVILLDDAFQHRAVRAGLYILLTEYERPFFRDWVLPAGRLREARSGYKRADVVIVSKCPEKLSAQEKKPFEHLMNKPLFFSHFRYGALQKWHGEAELQRCSDVILVCGIAQPEVLQRFLSKDFTVHPMFFKDHHDFSRADLEAIRDKFGKFAAEKTIIVTSEKDVVRLAKWQADKVLKDLPIFIQTIEVVIDKEIEFLELIRKYVSEN